MRKTIIKKPFEFIIHYHNDDITIQKYTMRNYYLDEEDIEISQEQYNDYLTLSDKFFENEYFCVIYKLMKLPGFLSDKTPYLNLKNQFCYKEYISSIKKLP